MVRSTRTLNRLKREIDTVERFAGKRHIWARGALIGKGAFGDVYEATNALFSDTACVIKVGTGPALFAEYSFYTRYLAEKQLMAATEKFGHPIYLPTGLDTGRIECDEDNDSTLYFIVMERYNPAVIGAHMNDAAFCRLVTDILYALKYIHSVGFFHGDIKASNILERAGDYYLCDFSITMRALTARNMAELNRDRAVDGMIRYAGRDMHETGHGPSYRADLDNLIFCMFEWAHGAIPWEEVETLHALYDAKQRFLAKPRHYLKSIASTYKRGCLKLFIEYANTLEFEHALDFDGLLRILGPVTPLKGTHKQKAEQIAVIKARQKMAADDPNGSVALTASLGDALEQFKNTVHLFNNYFEALGRAHMREYAAFAKLGKDSVKK